MRYICIDRRRNRNPVRMMCSALRVSRSGFCRHRSTWHSGPINRGVEISSQVADGPRSLVLDQVANGVFVRMAILLAMR